MHKIIISDPVRLRGAIEFAIANNCLEKFGVDLCRLLQVLTGRMVGGTDAKGQLKEADGPPVTAEICRDFAPHSFGFAIWVGEPSRNTLLMNGGWIYDGPTSPGDGSFPALSVNLSRLTGQAPRHSWNVHT
jgi:hypothetical protein